MHTAIISLRVHFVYVVFVLSISVQYVGCNLAVNVYVDFLGPISVISLGTPGTKSSVKGFRWRERELCIITQTYQLETAPSSHNGLPGQAFTRVKVA